MVENKPKHPGGRPNKMKNFIEAFKSVIEKDEFDVVILTDEELLMECNERLEDEDKIGERTFQSWKAGEVKSEEYEEFQRLMKKSLANQRRELFKKLQSDGQWQRYCWIIERKFDAWNLRNIGVTTNKIEVKTLDLSSIQEGIKE